MQDTYSNEEMLGAEFSICDSVKSIDRSDWDRIFGDIPEGYEFYRSVEESKLTELRFYYALFTLDRRLAAIAPIFACDFNLDIAVEGRLRSIILFIRKLFPRFLIVKALFCGSPFSEHGMIGLGGEVKNKTRVMNGFLKLLDLISKRENAKLTVFKDFTEEGVAVLSGIIKRGYFKVNSFPSAVQELNFSSFEEYLKTLGKATRKSLRRKIKDAYSYGKIEVKVLNDLEGLTEDVYRLYLNTHGQGATKFERLTREFFISVSRNMQPFLKAFLYYVDGRLGAFNLCFVYKDLFIDKFIGFDYDISRRFHLYFVSWSYNIQWCIENRIRFYKTGQTDYYAKIKLGSRLVPLYAYFKHRSAFFNMCLKLLSLGLKPGNFDSDIRDYAKNG